MKENFVRPDEFDRMIKLGESSYRPQVIRDLIEEIDTAKRALAVNYA